MACPYKRHFFAMRHDFKSPAHFWLVLSHCLLSIFAIESLRLRGYWQRLRWTHDSSRWTSFATWSCGRYLEQGHPLSSRTLNLKIWKSSDVVSTQHCAINHTIMLLGTPTSLRLDPLDCPFPFSHSLLRLFKAVTLARISRAFWWKNEHKTKAERTSLFRKEQCGSGEQASCYSWCVCRAPQTCISVMNKR